MIHQRTLVDLRNICGPPPPLFDHLAAVVPEPVAQVRRASNAPAFAAEVRRVEAARRRHALR
eukprot:5748661-Pleurochrysis_carterae.AAC.1